MYETAHTYKNPYVQKLKDVGCTNNISRGEISKYIFFSVKKNLLHEIEFKMLFCKKRRAVLFFSLQKFEIGISRDFNEKKLNKNHQTAPLL